MTEETVLTNDQIMEQFELHIDNPERFRGSRDFARAIEQAVLQSDPIQSMQGMADCMAMVRQEFIEAEVINESVPPMMVANAVLAEIQALRKDAGRFRKIASHIYEIKRTHKRGGDNAVRRLQIDIRNHTPSSTKWLETAVDDFDAAMEQQT